MMIMTLSSSPLLAAAYAAVVGEKGVESAAAAKFSHCKATLTAAVEVLEAAADPSSGRSSSSSSSSSRTSSGRSNSNTATTVKALAAESI